jgi:hypothetical protein
MAATQALSIFEATLPAEHDRLKRRQAVDSVLGTMGAEGELPSTKTLALIEEYVDGHMTMTQLVDTIFANARG